jgi:hypothetical protein
MKKIILSLVLFVTIASASKAQVLFNGAETLKKGNWSLGIDPVVATEGQDNFALFFHGGYGLGNNSDLGMKLGFGWFNDAYVGLDYEKTLLLGKPSVSLFGGAHVFHYFGLDVGGLVTFPIQNVRITTGLDVDFIFGEDPQGDTELWFPIWLPVSLEVYLKKNLSLVFEGNVKLTNEPYCFTTVGGGINIYF